MNNFRTGFSRPYRDRSARLGDHFIVILRRKEECSRRDAHAVEEQNNPADGAQDPGFVKCPANEEAVVVIVQVGLEHMVNTTSTEIRH